MTKPDSAQFVSTAVILGHASGHIQMGPDWKLYVSYYTGMIDTVSRINDPSSPGTACNFQMNAVGLTGHDNNNTLPQFLQSYKAYIHHAGHCFPDTTCFSGDIWPPPDSIHWEFGDPASGINNVSFLATPKHCFSSVGQYSVKLFVRHNDSRCDSTTVTVHIYPKPVPVISGFPSASVGSTYTYSTSPGMTNYQWTFSPGGVLVSGGGAGDDSVSIRWNTAGPQWVKVNYSNGDNCPGLSPGLILVMVSPVIPGKYEYWFAAPAVTHQVAGWSNLNNPIRFYLMTAEGPATVVVDQPANPSFVPILKTVNNDTAREVNLTPFIDLVENTPANTILNRGLRITSDRPLNVIYEVESPLNAATYTLGGKNALGYEFIIPAQSHYANHPDCSPPARNTIDIVATEDSTLVRILPRQAIIGHAANDTVSVVLNRGQTWSGRAASGDSLKHLGGSFVFAGKPVAVTVTDDAVFIPGNSGSFDITGDQLMPRHLCGTEFIPVSCMNASKLKLLISAFEDGTHVTLTDTSYVLTADLNRGESAEMLMDYADTISMPMGFAGYLVASKPVQVYQQAQKTILFSGETHQAAACVLPPVSCAGSYRTCLPQTAPYSTGTDLNELFWTLVTKNGNQGSFQVSIGIPASLDGFKTVPGTNGAYVYGIAAYSKMGGVFPNIIFTNNTGRFQLASGASTNNITGPTFTYFKYSIYSDNATLFLGTDRSICPGDSVFLDAGFGMTSYMWSTGATSQGIWVKTPGAYWVSTSEPDCQLSDTIN
ncbi:MAG TPA: hypothetical protein PKG48_14615, partial [Bacteroidales bacterium]|nr:hypothetical protein [Bacteroidales bacterium]